MTVNVTKPAINLRSELAQLKLTGPTISHILSDALATNALNWSAARRNLPVAQSIAHATWTILAYNTLDYDNLGELDATGRFTATAAGKYSVNARSLLAFSAWPASKAFEIGVFKNGTAVAYGERWNTMAATTTYATTGINTTISLAAGDYIDLRVIQNQGGTVNTLAGTQNWLAINRVS